MKCMFRICLALLLTLLLCGSALAEANVNYEGGAEKFVFLSDGDLFDNFKGVLPGDVIEQKIAVRNDTEGDVRIYLRAEPVSEQDRDFLDQLQLTVTTSGGKEIFDAAASETAQLTGNTLLGTFKSKGGVELTVTMTVPEDLGNDYMDCSGVVPWTFLAEEIPDDDTPQTGDWFQSAAWMGAIAIMATLLILLLARRRRETE